LPPTYRTWLVALLGVALVGFVAISLDVTHHGLLERHDASIGSWVVAHTPHALELAASAITKLGGAWSLIVLTALGAGLLLRRGNRHDAALLVGGLVLVSLATNGLKLAFGRPRPRFGDLTPVLHTASFPSGHTSGSVVVLVLLASLLATSHKRALVTGAVLLAGLVGATRVVVEAHWTTDVLAGYCLGIAVVAVVLIVRDRSSGGVSVVPPAGPEGERDTDRSGHEEREGTGSPFAEHRAHDLVPVDDLAQPQRR
jgi:membrane-associated phospholipid phosphatase